MDIQLEKKKGIQKKHIPYLIGGSVILLLLTWVVFGNHASTMRIDGKSINIADVSYGEFNDYIRLNGQVQPIQIVQISPEEGGIVREKVGRRCPCKQGRRDPQTEQFEPGLANPERRIGSGRKTEHVAQHPGHHATRQAEQ